MKEIIIKPLRKMTKKDCMDLFQIDDILDLPDAVMNTINLPLNERNVIYRKLLHLNEYNLSRDWFQDIYEAELSQRKQNKQDFTPNMVGVLASLLTSTPKGVIHEPTAGNGSMIIADWWNRCSKVLPFEFFPSENMYVAWELSARSIPILLLNLSIRGIMGVVYHGDVLEQKVLNKYILLNEKDDALGFSEIILDNENKYKIVKQ